MLNWTSFDKVFFYLKPMPQPLQLKIELVDRQRNCRRPLPLNSMLLSGDEINFEYGTENDKVYMVYLR